VSLQICFGGPLLFKEYWNNSAATAKAIDSDGYFRSGDIGRVDAQGFVYIMDREKDMIIRGGENISCAEVENAFYQHPKIHECAVFAIPDARLGEVVGVMIKLQQPNTLAAREIVEFVAASQLLAKFKQAKLEDVFFTDEPLPRGATGKIMKRTIRDGVKARLQKAKL